jgi:hypothetical protein
MRDFTILGGNPAFMDVFIRSSGGIDQLRSRFMQDIHAWQVPESFNSRILSQVGWR